MITEKCTLPIGIEHNGQIHRELELRPRLVKDMIAASKSVLVADNKNNYEVCCLAEQIIKIGDIPAEKITAELLLEMYEDDFNVLAETAEVARKRVASFRSEQNADQKGDTGTGENGFSAG